MPDENKDNSLKQKLLVYAFLTIAVLAVYWQVNRFDFIKIDDSVYVTQNAHIQSGITLDGLLWAFSTTYAEFWHPVTWLSLMLDYQFYGLNPAGYHLTNLFLHILSTLLLFWLFCRMTGEVWPSAFLAALFALHPLRVQSVAWIAERKDVLSAFFWMLTLCLYVYYTEKPVIKRYLLVLFSFLLGLMSKPMVVTLPVIMILLDYWPLNRFASQKNNLILWQLKEKTLFFILSAVFSVITIYAQYRPSIMLEVPFTSRLANASVSFVTYIEKIFWPRDIHLFHPFAAGLPAIQILTAILIILIASVAFIVMARRKPYLIVGWLWYAVTVLPVLGIMSVGISWRHDHYIYIPSIGIGIMLAWGIPSLTGNKDKRRKILLPVSIAILTILAVLSWKQCGYWKDTIELLNYTLKVTKSNYMVHYNRGSAYAELGQYENAIKDYNEAISLRPDNIQAYKNRGNTYAALGLREQGNDTMRQKSDSGTENINSPVLYRQAIEDLNNAIRLSPDCASYNNRGVAYSKLGQYKNAIEDFSKAIALNSNYYTGYNNRGLAYANLGQYENAIEDYNNAINLKPDYVKAYNNRADAYFSLGNKKLGCLDLHKACSLGDCGVLETARSKSYCR